LRFADRGDGVEVEAAEVLSTGSHASLKVSFDAVTTAFGNLLLAKRGQRHSGFLVFADGWRRRQESGRTPSDRERR
jgi:hypothetical protein